MVDESLIAQVTRLSMDGMKYYRDRVYTKHAAKDFPKKKAKRAKIVKKTASYYSILVFKPFWKKVLKVIMEYFTLDGHFTRVYGHHFVIMNHFLSWSQDVFPILSYVFPKSQFQRPQEEPL